MKHTREGLVQEYSTLTDPHGRVLKLGKTQHDCYASDLKVLKDHLAEAMTMTLEFGRKASEVFAWVEEHGSDTCLNVDFCRYNMGQNHLARVLKLSDLGRRTLTEWERYLDGCGFIVGRPSAIEPMLF
jgi:hypothetical protein